MNSELATQSRNTRGLILTPVHLRSSTFARNFSPSTNTKQLVRIHPVEQRTQRTHVRHSSSFCELFTIRPFVTVTCRMTTCRMTNSDALSPSTVTFTNTNCAIGVPTMLTQITKRREMVCMLDADVLSILSSDARAEPWPSRRTAEQSSPSSRHTPLSSILRVFFCVY